MRNRDAATGGYVEELDGLRGIAILAVMIHRMWPRASATPWPVEAGWAGVDLFFVVSGFLIAGILIDSRSDPDYFRNFYARRILRIFPLFYLLVGGMMLAFPAAGHEAFVREAGSPLWYLFQLGNVPESLLGRDPPYWLAPVWSLAIEEQFYLTFPLLIRYCEPARLGRWLAVIAGIALATRLVTTALIPDRERIQYLFTVCRLDTIAIGCLLAVFVRSERYQVWRARLPRVLVPVAVAAAAILFVTQLDRTTWFGRTFGYDVVALGFVSVVLLVLEYRDQPATAALRFVPLRYLGKLCFGLYLLHRPADTLVTELIARAGLDGDSLWWLPVKIAAATVLATISWRLVERPFLRLKQRFTARPRGLGAGGALAATVALLAACQSPTSAASMDTSNMTWADGGVDGGAIMIDGAIAMPSDGRTIDGGPRGMDAAPSDAAAVDAGPGDAAPIHDAGPPPHDAGSSPVDGPHDAGPIVTPPADAPHDAGTADVPPPDAPPDGPPPPPPGHVWYPEGQLLSPVTPDIAAELTRIAALAPTADHVFAKIGDSITVSTSFLSCFDGAHPDLGAHADLGDTIELFRAGDAAGATPYGRVSEAATGGFTASDMLSGTPSPLDRELTAITPRYGVTMLGTNDVRTGRTAQAFGADLWTIVDREIARGTIPILSTLPAMHGDPGGNANIPVANRVIRAIAQGRSLPLVDLHLALSTLTDEGIGPDGLHPTTAPEGGCALTESALGYGYNWRNLLSLQALDRTRRACSGQPIDGNAARRIGSGTHADPYLGQLPLADLADTRSGEATFASYPGCGVTASGHEIVYRLELTAQAAIDAYVIGRTPVDVDVAILSGSLSTASCVAGGDLTASATVGPGTVFVVVDSRSPASEGEFVVVVQAH